MKTHRTWRKFLLAGVLATGLALAGCSADDGKDGVNGINGINGTDGTNGTNGLPGASVVDVATLTPETLSALAIGGEVTGITIASPPVVNFTLTDAAGRGIKGLTTSNLRFALAKLIPGTNGSPDAWVSYMVTDTSRPSTENVAAGLVDHGDGSYTYTFTKDVATVPGVTYEPSLTHRLAIQVSGGGLSPGLVAHDFVPAGGDVVTQREIVSKAACNACHDAFTIHGGGRQDPKLCVVCHTDQRRIGRPEATVDANGIITGDANGRTYVVNGQALGNFANMVHKIHMGHSLTLQGYNYAAVLFNEIGYPQDPKNCRKCHQEGTATAQGDNWKNRPSRLACGACHDSVNFATGAGHSISNIAQADDANCAGCHTPAKIEEKHLTNYATPNNPDVPAGLANFTYEVSSVTVNDSNQPVVTFRILMNGAAMDLFGTALPAGVTGGPSFLIAYAAPQDGIAKPADWNQIGKSAGQPATVTLANVRNASQGGLVANADGTYTATLTAAAAAFPADATMRAAGLQGYFSQTETSLGRDMNGDGDTADSVGRYTKSVIKGVSGDPARRVVVENSKCLNCHETLQLHGGNRVDEVALCVTCHNPNLSSSGRTLDLAYPETSNNFKDMIHGIHGASKRESPLDFVRNFSENARFFTFISTRHQADFPDGILVHYPSTVNNCLKCHKEGTYNVAPADTLVSTQVTTNGAISAPADVTTSRGSLPNAADEVISPTAAACVSCHDSALAAAHMEQNGGAIRWLRGDVTAEKPVEACALCHGPGRSADLKVVHGLK